MIERNKTYFDQTHRIFISSPKPTTDRTALYIIILLCLLVFILIFYLIYNFISYKRYSSSLKKNKYSDNHLSTEIKLKNEEFIIPSQTRLLVSDL
jgi:hypothetical protein